MRQTLFFTSTILSYLGYRKSRICTTAGYRKNEGIVCICLARTSDLTSSEQMFGALTHKCECAYDPRAFFHLSDSGFPRCGLELLASHDFSAGSNLKGSLYTAFDLRWPSVLQSLRALQLDHDMDEKPLGATAGIIHSTPFASLVGRTSRTYVP